jgi:hypothetical protein
MTIDRRSFPRYPMVFPVMAQLEAHLELREFKAESVNLSRSSIEISCDNTLIDELLDQEAYPHTCKLFFQLPGQNYVFEIDSQVVTHRRLSQVAYHLVLIFPEFIKEKGDLLGEFLKEFQTVDVDQE